MIEYPLKDLSMKIEWTLEQLGKWIKSNMTLLGSGHKEVTLNNGYPLLQYERFVPPEFFEALGYQHLHEIKLGDHFEKEGTVLFSDIRSYTSLSEKMNTIENFNFLNAYIRRVVPTIYEQSGFIQQFLGDGIMALFLRQTDDAIVAALAYQKAIHQYNHERRAKRRIPINVGIGIHTGSLILGIIGNEDRMGTGVVSDAVNTASRIEDLTKLFGASVLVSENSFFRLGNPDEFQHRYLGKVKVKGKDRPLSVYDFFGGEDEVLVELKQESKEIFESAIADYYRQNFGLAKKKFKEVMKINPQDMAAKLYYKTASKAGNYSKNTAFQVELIFQQD